MRDPGILHFSAMADDTWAHALAVTREELVSAMVKKGYGPAVVQAIEAGTAPRTAIHDQTSMGQRETVVPLSSIVAMEWHEPDPDGFVTVKYEVDGKRKSLAVRPGIGPDQTRFVELLKSTVGKPFRLRQEPASVWYVGIGPMVIGVFAMLFLGAATLMAFEGPRPDRTHAVGRHAGKVEMFRALADTLGPAGMVILTTLVLAGIVGWWWWNCGHRPMRNELVAE